MKNFEFPQYWWLSLKENPELLLLITSNLSTFDQGSFWQCCFKCCDLKFSH